MPLPLGEVSPKVTERALPLPCGELPPQRLRGLQIGETKKMRLAKRLAFFRFDLCFGIIKGEQPLIRGSSASKSLALFWFSFGAKREQSPPGCSASKSPCPCRAKHAAFASQTGLRLKSPTGAFMPSGHRRPFWFSFGAKREQTPPGETLSHHPETFIYLLFFRFHCSRRIHARMLR